MPLPPVGVQLIVLGKKYNINTQTDLVLDAIARAGYEAVEGGGQDAAAYRRALDQYGLRYAGMHVTLPKLQDIDPIVADLRTLGAADVCNSGLMTWQDQSVESYKQAVGVLNEAGRKLRDEGIYLHYHNHDFEFKKLDGGVTGLQILIDGLDPEAVDLCVDVAWVQKGGENPVEFLLKHREIVGYLHFKDFNDEGWIEIGQGKVDFGALIKILPDLKARWVILEQDSTRIDPLDSMRISRAFLRERFQY